MICNVCGGFIDFFGSSEVAGFWGRDGVEGGHQFGGKFAADDIKLRASAGEGLLGFGRVRVITIQFHGVRFSQAF